MGVCVFVFEGPQEIFIFMEGKKIYFHKRDGGLGVYVYPSLTKILEHPLCQTK